MRRVLPCIMAMLVLVATVGAAPATKGPRSTKQGPPKRQKPYEIGRASWYGKPFHGRATASGEPYDMFQFTAAHRELPLGTWVKVTNLRNGKWLMARTNGRHGPEHGRRMSHPRQTEPGLLGSRQFKEGKR